MTLRRSAKMTKVQDSKLTVDGGTRELKTDSDSGHEKESSSATSSSIDLRHDLEDEQSESFVDAPYDFVLSEGSDDSCAGCCKPSSPTYGDPDLDLSELNSADLKARLQETTLVMQMALNNEFNRALNRCSSRADKDLYASLATATLSFLRAALTLEQADLQAALHAINQSFEVSSMRRRKTSTASMMMRFIYKPNYNSYTDDEVHAELVHAESLILLALISFLADQSIICLVKGAFRIRACYQRYKECLYIMENRRQWSSAEAREHFESGVRMGHGIFNLLMSYLPRRVLRFLEYVGFSGNRTVGVDELERSVALNDGLRSVFSALVILAYHSYIENIFGLGNYDASKVEQLNKLLLNSHPNSAFFLLFLGRYHQMGGNLDEAIHTFERCIAAQDDWKQFHSICHWEMMWCYAVQMDWSKAAHYSDLLRKRSKWSPASYTYQYGTFLYAQLVEDERQGLCNKNSAEHTRRMEEIREIMQQVPALRIRHAGKTIPAEKFAITRSIKFCEQNNRLSVPALEFLYIWNIFVTLQNSPQLVERLLERINEEIDYITDQIKAVGTHKDSTTGGSQSLESDHQNSGEEDESTSSSSGDFHPTEDTTVGAQAVDNWQDELNLVLLLKGLCLKYLSKLDEAEEYFLKVINNESEIENDTFLVPHTAMELALLNLTRKQYGTARRWVKKARNDYTGYLLETVVHFRLHAASRIVRLEQQDLELNSSIESTSQVNVNDNNKVLPTVAAS